MALPSIAHSVRTVEQYISSGHYAPNCVRKRLLRASKFKLYIPGELGRSTVVAIQ